MTDQEKYADKVAKLLRKAESTTPEEAELLIEKAQQLMTQHAIDEALLDSARGTKRKDPIVEEPFDVKGPYVQALYEMGSAVFKVNGCRVLRSRLSDRRYVIHAIGFRSDVSAAGDLHLSLQMQAVAAMQLWWKDLDVPAWWNGHDKWRARREFLFGFSRTVSVRLSEAAREGRKAARAAEAEKVGTEAAAESVALVIRSKKKQVDDWVDETYGKLRSGRPSYYGHGGQGAREAGAAAGARADVSRRGRVSGRGKELGR